MKQKRNKKFIFLFVLCGIFLGCDLAFGQLQPLQKAVPQVAPVKAESSMTDKGQILDKLMDTLGVNKAIDQAIEYSGYYLKSVPKTANPVQQKKINDLYAAAQKDFDSKKEKTKMQTISEIKDQYSQKFSIEELKYLLTLSQYEVFKKYNSLLDSEPYAKATATPFTLTREAMTKLHEQVKSIDKTLKPKN